MNVETRFAAFLFSYSGNISNNSRGWYRKTCSVVQQILLHLFRVSDTTPKHTLFCILCSNKSKFPSSVIYFFLILSSCSSSSSSSSSSFYLTFPSLSPLIFLQIDSLKCNFLVFPFFFSFQFSVMFLIKKNRRQKKKETQIFYFD